MACITESGRILDLSLWEKGGDIMELSEGVWVTASRIVSGDEVMNARVLSAEELSQLLDRR